MNKRILPFVEIMITQTCNLSCAGCTNYSDLLHKGYLTWNEGKEQIEPWLARVDFPDFSILGGEPLMNPKIRDWIIGLRELMPESQIRLTTNALLLDRNFDIVDLLADIGNCVFKIAVHEQNEKIEQVINRVYDHFDWEPIFEYGIHRHQTKNNMKFYVRRPDYFYKSFQGPYNNMRPHSSNPADAFNVCCQQTCPLIYNGKIYKCSTSALLKDTLARFNNPNIEQWQPYLLDGLDLTCSDSELDKFLNNFGKPHSMCQMCPTKQDSKSILLHLDHVSRKKIK